MKGKYILCKLFNRLSSLTDDLLKHTLDLMLVYSKKGRNSLNEILYPTERYRLLLLFEVSPYLLLLPTNILEKIFPENASALFLHRLLLFGMHHLFLYFVNLHYSTCFIA